MSHHGSILSDYFNENKDELKKFQPSQEADLSELIYSQEKKPKAITFGATGEFPDGKLNELDEGGIRFGITVVDGKLIMNFGAKPITWIGFTKAEAIDLIKYLNNRISELR